MPGPTEIRQLYREGGEDRLVSIAQEHLRFAVSVLDRPNRRLLDAQEEIKEAVEILDAVMEGLAGTDL